MDERYNTQIDNGSYEMISVQGLTKYYKKGIFSSKKYLAVNNIHFNVNKNECYGFIGANGAGKTTTIKMLILQEKPTSGTALINNYNILDEKNNVYKQIGYCPQDDT
uniref:ABC transporter A family member 1 n=1 Tax=Lygus hesperus TaxID=30085 RepID=A0A0A9YFA4_LYGHE